MWLKRLIIEPGQALSLQSHEHRKEYWFTEDKGVWYQLESSRDELMTGIVFYVARGVKHRLWNASEEPVVVVEWAIGSPRESDIICYDDIYGR